jgi:hypothetical protein
MANEASLKLHTDSVSKTRILDSSVHERSGYDPEVI